MKLTRDNRTIALDNGYWVVVHDLTRGGALSEITFKHGVNGNMLAAPAEMGVGKYLDVNDKDATVRIEERDGRIALVFMGTLKDSNGEGSIGFMQGWTYYDYGVHRSQQLYCDASEIDPHEIVAIRLRIDPRYSHILAQPKQQFWHDGKTEEVHYGLIPRKFGLFADTGEGMQFVRGDDLAVWGYNPQSMDTTRGDFACRMDESNAIVCELAPLKNLPEGVTAEGHADGCFAFDSFLGISNYKSKPYLPYRELSISSQPFPSDTEIRGFAEIGINVLRIHEGANFVGFTADHWMDGTFPPFQGKQLTEMKRMIKTAHLYGIKVIPYFMPWGVHPLSPAFREHPREWQYREMPDQAFTFASLGDGQVWETYFCPETEWKDWLLEHVTKVLKEYDFDGFYFDGLGSCTPCFHPDHARVPHAGQKTLLDILYKLRKRFPDAIVFGHQMCIDVNILNANLVDHIINLEEFGLKTPEEMRPLPFGVIAQRACASISPVPQPFLPKDGEAVCKGLVMVKYMPGKGPTATRQLARRGFPYCIVHGVLPYLYTWMEKLTLGYRTHRDRMEDKEGFYYFYRLLKVLSNYEIEQYFSPAEQSLGAPGGVISSVLKTREGCLILLTSIADGELKDAVISVNPEAAAHLKSKAWRSAKVIASTNECHAGIGQGGSVVVDSIGTNDLVIIEVM